jgi:hypothetical protein
LVEALTGQAGWLRLYVLTIEALEKEDHLVFGGITDSGAVLDQETCRKFFNVPGDVGQEQQMPADVAQSLST